MRKATKKTTRKKNLSVKSNVQYVRNLNGELFILKNGMLAQGRNGWRSVRLSDLRKSIESGYQNEVNVTTRYTNGRKAFTMPFIVGTGTGHYDNAALNIGCQQFDAVNAAKILKRAKVTV